MKRIYHHYELWEDYKCGFYSMSKFDNLEMVVEMFCSEEKTDLYMNYVIDNWKYSCEHNLTNKHLNHIAYIGQAASCVYTGCPSLYTMKAWKMIDVDVKKRADNQAKKTILKWKKRYLNTLNNGGKEDMNQQYLMKFHGFME